MKGVEFGVMYWDTTRKGGSLAIDREFLRSLHPKERGHALQQLLNTLGAFIAAEMMWELEQAWPKQEERLIHDSAPPALPG